jgi:hypothetical protein
MMSNSNKIKADLLGMPFGTACSKLRKALLFDFVKRLHEDSCYRCGEAISSIEEFSIEHKNAWSKQLSPVDAFFDLNNISYSHLKCNTGAANIENKKIYPNNLEKHRAENKRKYGNPQRYAHHLEYKREWYHKNKSG